MLEPCRQEEINFNMIHSGEKKISCYVCRKMTLQNINIWVVFLKYAHFSKCHLEVFRLPRGKLELKMAVAGMERETASVIS